MSSSTASAMPISCPADLGRRLCGGGPDPDAARAVTAALVNAWISAVAAAVPLPAVPGTRPAR